VGSESVAVRNGKAPKQNFWEKEEEEMSRSVSKSIISAYFLGRGDLNLSQGWK